MGRGRGTTNRKHARKEEAKRRQEAWDALSNEEQLQKIFDQVGHHDSKQEKRLRDKK